VDLAGLPPVSWRVHSAWTFDFIFTTIDGYLR
jgi:hypothetical protein